MDESKNQPTNNNPEMIALYNWDVSTPDTTSLDAQCMVHKSICDGLNIAGKININKEGLNGVLTGTQTNLQIYEKILRLYMANHHDGRQDSPVISDENIDDEEGKNMDIDEEEGFPSLEMTYGNLIGAKSQAKNVFNRISIRRLYKGDSDDDKSSTTEDTICLEAQSNGKEEGLQADISLILGAERTLFAAINNAWLLAIGGIGLMSVGNGDERATKGGIFIVASAVVCTVIAYMMHVWRVQRMKSGKSFSYFSTIFWISMIAALTLLTLILELYFGVLHPYLDREKAVTIANIEGFN